MTIFQYLFNLIYLFLDVGVNTIVGGHREESISSRCGKGKLVGKPVHTILANIINYLFFWEDNHCYKYIQHRPDTHSVSTLWDKNLRHYRNR